MDLRRITDFDAPELDVYARLTENQLLNRADPQNALFVAESPLVIGRALDAGCAPVSFLMETKHVTGKGAALQHGRRQDRARVQRQRYDPAEAQKHDAKRREHPAERQLFCSAFHDIGSFPAYILKIL